MPSGWDWAALAVALTLLAIHQVLLERRWRRLCRAIESIRRRDDEPPSPPRG